MNKSIAYGEFLLACAILLPGCDLVANIFEAGVWVGVLGVIAVIALVIWLVSKAIF